VCAVVNGCSAASERSTRAHAQAARR
jgi:hypothetical protein